VTIVPSPQLQVRLGTRGSALAREQTRRVMAALAALRPDLELIETIVSTAGDRDKRTPLTVIGGQGVFARELQTALLAGTIDVAVHSAKDLPTEPVPGLVIGAFFSREDARDVLVSRDGRSLADLPPGARVGTSSRRRLVALRRLRPDLEAVDLRGNLDTRLRKVREGEVDAAILAAAGLLRMGWQEHITEFLSLDDFVPAPGQGALAIECRADDPAVNEMLAALNDPAAALAARTERSFLRALGGGCRSPIGAHATVSGDTVTLRVMLGDEAMTRVRLATWTLPAAEAETRAGALAVEVQRSLAGADPLPV